MNLCDDTRSPDRSGSGTLEYKAGMLTRHRVIKEPSSPERDGNEWSASSSGLIYARNYTTVCETLSLTLRGEHRLRVFENRVLRRIFGPKRDDIIGS
jgi:hypothetical protein